MKARWKILIAAGIFLALAGVIWFANRRIQPANALETYLKSLRENGEKLKPSEILARPVAAESNGISLVQAALISISAASDEWTNLPCGLRMIAPGKALVGWRQPEVQGDDFINSWEYVRAVTEASRPAIELLEQAAAFPAIDFQLDYTKADQPLPHLAFLQSSAVLLSAAAMVHLHDGDTKASLTNLYALLALVRGEQTESCFPSQACRAGMASNAVAATWEFLQSIDLTESELAQLQNDWEQVDYFDGLERAALISRALVIDTYDKFRASKILLPVGPPSLSGDWLEDAKERLGTSAETVFFREQTLRWKSSWSFADELPVLQGIETVLDGTRASETNAVLYSINQTVQSRLAGLASNTIAREAFICNVLKYRICMGPGALNYFGKIYDTVLTAEASRRVVIAAIALKRFQAKHGHYPEELSELAPKFIAAVPLDAMDGQPLRYRRNIDGTFVLYSVGLNGQDDGGDAAVPGATIYSNLYWLNPLARDWVWPQPATEAAIK